MLGYIDCRTAYGCPAGLYRAASVLGQRCPLTYKEHCAGPQVVGQHVVKETYQCAQTETLNLIRDRLISAYNQHTFSCIADDFNKIQSTSLMAVGAEVDVNTCKYARARPACTHAMEVCFKTKL